MFILKSFRLSLCIPPAVVAKVTPFSMLSGYSLGAPVFSSARWNVGIKVSGERQPALGLRNWPRSFARGLEMGVNHRLCILQGFDPRSAIRDDAREFRHLGQKLPILLAPINHNFVFAIHRSRLFRS